MENQKIDFVDAFMANTALKKSATLREIVEYLWAPEQVNKLLVLTEMGEPALAGVVKALEARYGTGEFALNCAGVHKNVGHRTGIGWIIRAIMTEYGYETTGQRKRLGGYGANYFKTASVYEKTGEGNYRLETKRFSVGRDGVRDTLKKLLMKKSDGAAEPTVSYDDVRNCITSVLNDYICETETDFEDKIALRSFLEAVDGFEKSRKDYNESVARIGLGETLPMRMGISDLFTMCGCVDWKGDC